MQIRIPANPRYLAFVRRLVETATASVRLIGPPLDDLKLAITEACTNVIKHAFKYDYAQTMGLTLVVSADGVVVRLVYEDAGFKPDEIPAPNLAQLREGGLGVFIIRHVMDDVAYSCDGATGQVELRMVKFLPWQRSGDPGPLVPRVPDPEEDRPDGRLPGEG